VNWVQCYPPVPAGIGGSVESESRLSSSGTQISEMEPTIQCGTFLDWLATMRTHGAH
jgi:hypothetical protein